LITAQDMAITRPAVPGFAVPAMAARAAPPLRERMLLLVLFISVLLSSIAFVEPSPHDLMMPVLAVACIAAGVRFERSLVLLFLLLLIWNLGGLLSLLNVPDQQRTIQYAATSLYLALAAVMYACLFADNVMPRLVVLRTAYVLTAVFVSLIGALGYFHAFPHAGDLFAPSGRALGAFKDPNVFGPFLIWPALIVLERMMVRRVHLLDLLAVGVILLGLLLSFSRGAWFHFAVSCAAMIALAFVATPSRNVRLRIFTLSVIGIGLLAAFIAISLSFHSVDSMFIERFHLIQPYDVGTGGRFRLQELALAALLKYPNGMGPFQFSVVHGLQQHNVYLQAFMVYGWIGGMTYIVLLGATFLVALRSVLVPTPWQPYMICTFAAFLGEVLEGFVIDTDHWRHFFLLLGLIWGLGAATAKHRRRQQSFAPKEQWAHVGAA
jgi:hypothetical protein